KSATAACRRTKWTSPSRRATRTESNISSSDMNTQMQRAFAVLIVTIAVVGCSATALHEHGYDNYAQGTAERLLVLGIQAYENGDLKRSSERLTGALNSGLTFNKDKVTAYKYLA